MAGFGDLGLDVVGVIATYAVEDIFSSYGPRALANLLRDDILVEGNREPANQPPCLSFLPEPDDDESPLSEKIRLTHPQPSALSRRAQECTRSGHPSQAVRTISVSFPLHDTSRATRAAARAAPEVSHAIDWIYAFWSRGSQPATAIEIPWHLIASGPLCSCVLQDVDHRASRCRVLHAIFPGRGGQTPRKILSAFRAAAECILEHLNLQFDAWSLTHREIHPEILRAPSIRSSRTLNSSFIAVGPRLTVLHIAAQTSELRFPLTIICAVLVEAPELEEVVFLSALRGPAVPSPDKIILPRLKHFHFQDASEHWRLLRQTLDLPGSCPSVHLELISSPARKSFDMDSWRELCNTFLSEQLIPPFSPKVAIVDIIRDALDTNDVEISDYRWPQLMRLTISDAYDGALVTNDCRSSKARWSIAIRNGLIAPSGSASRERRARFKTPSVDKLMGSLMRALGPATAGVEVFSVHSRLGCWHIDFPERWIHLLQGMNVHTLVVHGINGIMFTRFIILGQQLVETWDQAQGYYIPEVSRRINKVILPDWAAAEEPQAYWDRQFSRRRGQFPIQLARTGTTTQS